MLMRRSFWVYVCLLCALSIHLVGSHAHACSYEDRSDCIGDGGEDRSCSVGKFNCGGGGEAAATPTPIPYLAPFAVQCTFTQRTGGVERLATDSQPLAITTLGVDTPSYISGGAACPPNPACIVSGDSGAPITPGSRGATTCLCQFAIPPSTCIAASVPLRVNSTSRTPCIQNPLPALTTEALLFTKTTYRATVTHDCSGVGPWIKLIDASFIHTSTLIPPKSLVNDQPFIIDAFSPGDTAGTPESDDLSFTGMSGGAGGVIANVTVGQTGRYSDHGWSAPGYAAQMSTSALYAFAAESLRTKPYTLIAPDTEGTLTLTPHALNVVELPPGETYATISRLIMPTSTAPLTLIIKSGTALGSLVLSGDTYNASLLENPSLLVVSEALAFSHPGDVQAKGIFIANRVSTGAGSTLKIIGNLICTGEESHCIQERNRSDGDHARPSVLIRVDAHQYLDLLPMIGKVKRLSIPEEGNL